MAFGLLQAAEQWGFLIVENDAFADIVPPAFSRLAALDQLNRVLYLGTFSKTLSASLRCGFIAGHPSLIGPLTDMKLLTCVATSDHVERFVFNLIQGGQYLRHLRRLRSRVESANAAAVTELEEIGLSVRMSKVPASISGPNLANPSTNLPSAAPPSELSIAVVLLERRAWSWRCREEPGP